MESLGFWDVAPIIYLVGFALAFVLVHDRLSKPECYRIPFAIVIAAFWPVALALVVLIYIEGLIQDLRAWILNKYEH